MRKHQHKNPDGTEVSVTLGDRVTLGDWVTLGDRVTPERVLLSGVGLYGWCVYVQKVPRLAFGCEDLPLKDWTAGRVLELLKQHDPKAEEQLRNVLAAARAVARQKGGAS